MKCSFCGYEFNEEESKSACSGCPLNKTCGKQKCPNCGYEMVKEPGFIKMIKNWGKRNG